MQTTSETTRGAGTIDVPTLKRLADIGGSALRVRMAEEAETIFSAIVPFCPPRSSGPLIGLAVARYAQGASGEAIRILSERALVDTPHCPDALSHLAMVLRSEGRIQESEAFLAQAASNATDDDTRAFIELVESGWFDGHPCA